MTTIFMRFAQVYFFEQTQSLSTLWRWQLRWFCWSK